MVITAAMMMVLLGILALSMDMGYVLSGRTQLQNGVDSAARAAASGLRAAIEPGAGYSYQDASIIKPLAKRYASLNTVRRYPSVKTTDTAHYPDGLKDDPNNAILLNDGDIQIQHDAQPPRVIIKHRLDQDPNIAPPASGVDPGSYNNQRQRGKIPTIFAGIFGVEAVGIGAGAIGTVIPVEGGSGLISGGWRPLLLPDTYFNASNQVLAYGELSHPVPDATAGDYYRSRYAGGAHDVAPFIDGSVRDLVTSIRDAKGTSELRPSGGTNLLAQPITIKSSDWRLVDFNTSYPGTVQVFSGFPGFEIKAQISNGYNGYVRVGDMVTVYAKGDPIYASGNVLTPLRDLAFNNGMPDFIHDSKLTTYGYVESDFYPTPNTHLRVIPVMLCSPIYLAQHQDDVQYRVTNIGAFFLQSVSTTGDLTGYFVREVFVGGLPLQAQNEVTNRNLLPVSVRVLQ